MTEIKGTSQGVGFAVETDGDAFPGLQLRKRPSSGKPGLNRYAVGSGLAAAMIVCGLLAPQISRVMAGDSGDAMRFLLEQGQKGGRVSSYAPVGYPAQSWIARTVGAAMAPLERPAPRRASRAAAVEPAPRRAAAVGPAPRRAAAGEPAPRRAAPQAVAASFAPSAGAGGLSRRSVCVRLCDGFFFPVGDLADDSQTGAHEQLCAAECPGAPTALYVVPAGTERMEEAMAVRTHKPYSALPVAFRHMTKTDRTCSCHAEVAQNSLSLLKDFTLRKGDGVATPAGIKLFRGAKHWPYKRADFATLAQASDLTPQDRSTLVALERAAKGLKPVVKASQKAAALPADKATPVASVLSPDGRSVRFVGPATAMLDQ